MDTFNIELNRGSLLLELVLVYFIQLVIPLLIAVIFIAKWPRISKKLLTIGAIVFTVLMFPIFDYNCLWNIDLIIPDGYYPMLVTGGFPLGIEMERPSYYQFLDYLFIVCEYVLRYVLWFCIPIFIYLITRPTHRYIPQWKMWQCWLPVIGLFFIWDNISKRFEFSIWKKAVAGLCMLFSGGWVYFNFIAPMLFFGFGLDSFTFVSDLLFRRPEGVIEGPAITDASMGGLTYFSDIMLIVIPFFLFISSVFFLPVLHWINIGLNKEKEIKLSISSSEIDQD